MPKFSIATLPDLSGKVALVTGGTNGLGEISARDMALKGARVYITARSTSKASATIARANEHLVGLRAKAKAKGRKASEEFGVTIPESQEKLDLHPLECDLTDLASVQSAASTFTSHEERLDILMNNAGVCAVDYALTKDGIEVQNATNLIAHYFLTMLLLPTLVRTSERSEYAPAHDGSGEKASVRIVFLSSLGHKLTPPRNVDFGTLEGINDEFADTKFAAFRRYAMSKTGCILLARELSNLLRSPTHASNKKAISVLCADPGQSKTGLASGPIASYGLLFKIYHWLATPTYVHPEQAVETQLFAACSPDVERRAMSGTYIEGSGKECQMSELAQDKTGKAGKDLLRFGHELFIKFGLDTDKVWEEVGVKPPAAASH